MSVVCVGNAQRYQYGRRGEHGTQHPMPPAQLFHPVDGSSECDPDTGKQDQAGSDQPSVFAKSPNTQDQRQAESDRNTQPESEYVEFPPQAKLGMNRLVAPHRGESTVENVRSPQRSRLTNSA